MHALKKLSKKLLDFNFVGGKIYEINQLIFCMQNSQLNRVISLVKRTGDKTVIMDNESDAVMMLMDLGMYEKMLDNHTGVEKLTEEELMEKINRDVAIWRARNDKDLAETYDKVMTPVAVREQTPTAPVYVPTAMRRGPAEAVAKSEEPMMMEKGKEVNLVKVESLQSEQEHSAGDIVAEEDEEKFYLEPVE